MILYLRTVLVKVFLGYSDGVAYASVTAASPIYGQLVSERLEGIMLLQLWPWDFPMNTKASTTIEPLHVLWKPEVSVALESSIAFTGLERLRAGQRWRWLAQRWYCEPKTSTDILQEMRRVEIMRPREVNARPKPRG
jgi:hypothetical protein